MARKKAESVEESQNMEEQQTSEQHEDEAAAEPSPPADLSDLPQLMVEGPVAEDAQPRAEENTESFSEPEAPAEGPRPKDVPAYASEVIPDEYPEELAAAEDPTPELTDRQRFFALRFNDLDRHLTPAERAEWSSIYASYRGRSALHGRVIGVDTPKVRVWNRETEESEVREMNCAVIVPHRVRIIIPEREMWEPGVQRPGYVMQNITGANLDFIITMVDREGGYAVASRSMAARARRYYFAHRPALNTVGSLITCKLLAVGPRRCLVECYGHDIELTQREMRYTAIPDLRNEYHPGQELPCIVKGIDPDNGKPIISIKETESNPFDGAELRHPIGSRRIAEISGKYGGGVFCNLPDGTVCMCNYSYQHEDSDFLVGDTVILILTYFDNDKKQIYGKILSKW